MITKNRSLDRKKIVGFLPYLIVVLIFVGMGGIVDDVITYIYVSRECKYTVSTEIEYGSYARGPSRRYYYTVNGRKFNSSTRKLLKEDGVTYFIKFYPSNPRRSLATDVIADSNAIKNLPPDGYKEIPR